MRSRPLWMALLVTIGLASVGWAAPQETAAAAQAGQGNHLVTFKGVLKDADGKARPGAAAVTFTLYAAQEGGDALWQESQVVQADVNKGNRQIGHGINRVLLPFNPAG